MSAIVRVEPAAADALSAAWIAQRLREAWGSTEIVSRGRMRDAAQLPAIVCRDDDEVVGIATYAIDGDACELVTLDAFRPREGIGTALLRSVADEARSRGCRRLWLVTTNDNLDALRFYQRRGLRLVAVHRGAVEEARRSKPQIPRLGHHGIAICDEIELELAL